MEMLTLLWVNDEYSLPGLNTKIHTTKEKTKYRIISCEKGRITQYLQTYLKQLGELCQLRDNGILTEEEYEDQREDLIDSRSI